MNSQTPAEGILKIHDFGNSKWYKVVCNCGDSNHDVSFEVEANDYSVNVNTFVNISTDYWSESVKKRYDIENKFLQKCDWFLKDLWNNFVTCVKLTWTIWTKGQINTQSTIVMTEQQALNYADILKVAINDVKNFKKS
jgi:hypothetical protein